MRTWDAISVALSGVVDLWRDIAPTSARPPYAVWRSARLEPALYGDGRALRRWERATLEVVGDEALAARVRALLDGIRDLEVTATYHHADPREGRTRWIHELRTVAHAET